MTSEMVAQAEREFVVLENTTPDEQANGAPAQVSYRYLGVVELAALVHHVQAIACCPAQATIEFGGRGDQYRVRFDDSEVVWSGSVRPAVKQ